MTIVGANDCAHGLIEWKTTLLGIAAVPSGLQLLAIKPDFEPDRRDRRVDADGGISHLQNVSTRPLVFFQGNCFSIGETFLEFFKRCAGSAPETIDRLVR